MLQTLQQYNGDSAYLVLFVLSIAALCLAGRGDCMKTGRKGMAALLLSVLFVFNGAAYWFIGHFTDTTTYYRFFWMLPVVFVLACIFVRQFFSGSAVRVAGAVFVLVLCMLTGGNFFINRTNLSRPQNVYGIADDTVSMADAVMADWEAGGKDASPADGREHVDGPVVALDIFLEYQMRTYEPRISWAISRKAYLYQAKHGYDYKNGKYKKEQRMIAAVNEGLMENAGALRRSLEGTGTDYLVIRTEFGMDGYLEQISVRPVLSRGNYTLYKVQR